LLDVFVRLLIWTGALGLSIGAFNALGLWPKESLVGAGWGLAWLWAKRIGWCILLFNIFYVAELIALRLLIPMPNEGRYPISGGVPSRQLIWAGMLGALAKARYEAPFPGFLAFQIANLPPLCWLMGPIVGPKSRSCYATDPRILDPQGVELGRNVVIGFNATVAAHYQDRDSLTIKRTIIEDDVVVGGHAVVYGGVHIQQGAIIGAGAIVLPDTVVGPNEFWGGVPARKIRDLPPLNEASAT
jgi:acetyltransferase-like isoleucine patch superfamily enzyme